MKKTMIRLQGTEDEITESFYLLIMNFATYISERNIFSTDSRAIGLLKDKGLPFVVVYDE